MANVVIYYRGEKVEIPADLDSTTIRKWKLAFFPEDQPNPSSMTASDILGVPSVEAVKKYLYDLEKIDPEMTHSTTGIHLHFLKKIERATRRGRRNLMYYNMADRINRAHEQIIREKKGGMWIKERQHEGGHFGHTTFKYAANGTSSFKIDIRPRVATPIDGSHTFSLVDPKLR